MGFPDLAATAREPERVPSRRQRTPTRKDLAGSPPWSEVPALEVFAEQLEVARSNNFGPNSDGILAAMDEAIQATLSGQSTVESALARAQEEITPLLPE